MKKYLKVIGVSLMVIGLIIFFIPNKLSQTRNSDKCLGFRIQIVCFGIADNGSNSTIQRKIDFWKTPNKFCGTEGTAVPTVARKCCEGLYDYWGDGSGAPGGLGICRKIMPFSLKQIDSKYKIHLPINDSREAIEFLKNKNEISLKNLINIENNAGVSLIIHSFPSKKYANSWTVLVRSQDAIPSYSCEYTLHNDGTSVRKSYKNPGCGWNK